MKIINSKLFFNLAVIGLLLVTFLSVQAQDDQAGSTNIEEITVTGSQIKGAKITGALPVSVLEFTDIDSLGRIDIL